MLNGEYNLIDSTVGREFFTIRPAYRFV